MQSDEDSLRSSIDIDLVVPLGEDSFVIVIFDVVDSDELTGQAHLLPIFDSANSHVLEEGYGFFKAHPHRKVQVISYFLLFIAQHAQGLLDLGIVLPLFTTFSPDAIPRECV